MLSYNNPANWAALPKAAFVVTGIISEDTELNLQDIRERCKHDPVLTRILDVSLT
jgi:hypothetical protein